MSRNSWAQQERQDLCLLFDELGPDAPTLCGTWTTRDLAAHLVVREARPDAAAGIVAKPFAAWTERVQQRASARPWPELVDAVRSGPPTLSFFSLPKVDEQANTTEYFVHLEDVRRAQPDWQPRELPNEFRDVLWRTLAARARLFYRKVPVAVTLERTDMPSDSGVTGATIEAGKGSASVTVRGEAAELMMFSFGRKSHCIVELVGDESAVQLLLDAPMSV